VNDRKNDATTAHDAIRREAQERLGETSDQPIAVPQTHQEALRLVHELQVHQIELEMQNEELLRSRALLEGALERYAELYDFAPVGYFTLDGEGVVERANLHGARLLGLERADLVGRPFATFLATIDAAAFDALVAKTSTAQLEESCEVMLAATDADGLRRFARLTVSSSKDGSTRRVIAVDVSDRRRAEERLREWHKMEAVGRLAAGVAHDFNNLLTVIVNHASLAIEALGTAGSDTTIREGLHELSDAADLAAVLTRQLLAFGRKQRMRREPIDPSKVILGSEKILRGVLGAEHELVLRLAPDIEGVEAEPSQLEEVIMNLAINARDAMTKPGTLTIATKRLDVASAEFARYPMQRSGPFVMLSVGDTGEGMTSATMAHIFEPFFTTKGKGRGSGFGLSTVYGIVKQCGGDISVRSAKGEGTTFDIYLPRVDMPAPKSIPDRATSKARRRGTETILVVDDESLLRKTTGRLLTLLGYQVIEAESGAQALRILETHPSKIHLVLTDVAMPLMSGVVLASHVKALHPETRIVHMSGYADESIDSTGVISHLRFLSKPFTTAALAEKISDVLDAPWPPSEATDL